MWCGAMVGIAAWLLLIAAGVGATPLTHAEIEQLCGEAEDQTHCGRLIEGVQMKRLPGLAQRNGDTLLVTLYPSGSTSFVDSTDAVSGRAYSLWDSLDPINSVVLYTTQADNISFTLLQRATNRRIELPNEPVLSPDRQRLLTADFCPSQCVNQLAVWRVSKDGVRKELVWAPKDVLAVGAATWKDPDTVMLEFTVGDADHPTERKLERKLSDPGWQRVAAP